MRDTNQTTYDRLANSRTTAVNALIRGTTKQAMHSKAVHERAAATSSTPPAVGEYWVGQGGILAGTMRDGDHQWHLLLAALRIDTTTPESATPTYLFEIPRVVAAWGKPDQVIPGEFSRRNGRHNSNLILAADSENKIARHCASLLIDGHKDFYWPSQCESNLLFANLPEKLNTDWHWSSTQHSALDAWLQYFDIGYQSFASKGNSLEALAVRRILIDSSAN